MAHIAHQPGPVRVESGLSRWLVGVVGLGAELHQRPHAARGALLQFDCLTQKNALCPLAFVWAPAPKAQGEVPERLCRNSQALSNVQEVTGSGLDLDHEAAHGAPYVQRRTMRDAHCVRIQAALPNNCHHQRMGGRNCEGA
jgi:hypothetical protein